jgi:hypothetical protein
MARSAYQYDYEVRMTLYPNGPGEAADVVVGRNPDPAVAAEIERIHQHEVEGFRSSVGLVEDRMHDLETRPDLFARRCTCHNPPRVHGIYLIPKRFPEPTRDRPDRGSQYHLYFAHSLPDGVRPLLSHAVETTEHRLMKQYQANVYERAGWATGVDDRVLPKMPGMQRRRKPDVWVQPSGGRLHTREMQFSHRMTAAQAVRLATDHRIAGAATTSWVGATGNDTLDGFNWRVPIVRINPNEMYNMTPGSRTAILPARELEWERTQTGALVPKAPPVMLPNGDPRRFTLDEFELEVIEGRWVSATLPDGVVRFMSPEDAATLAEYVAQHASKANRRSAWTTRPGEHRDAPMMPFGGARFAVSSAGVANLSTSEEMAQQQARAEQECAERERLERLETERRLDRARAETLERRQAERAEEFQRQVADAERWNRENAQRLLRDRERQIEEARRERERRIEEARRERERRIEEAEQARIAKEKAEREAEELRRRNWPSCQRCGTQLYLPTDRATGHPRTICERCRLHPAPEEM